MNPIYISTIINKIKDPNHKICGHCKLEKPKEEFNNLSSWCLRCTREYNRNYYHSHKKKE